MQFFERDNRKIMFLSELVIQQFEIQNSLRLSILVPARLIFGVHIVVESSRFHDLVIGRNRPKEVLDEVDFFRGARERRLEGLFDAFGLDVKKVLLFDDFYKQVFDLVFYKLFIEMFDFLGWSWCRICGSFVCDEVS